MMKRSTILTYSLLATLLLGVLQAAPAHADELDDLKASFKARYPKLQALIQAGKVGETYLGTVEAVKGGSLDGDASGIVSAENADRAKLYAIIAKQQNTTPQLVAARNAMREFSNAKSGEWLKYKDGWKQK